MPKITAMNASPERRKAVSKFGLLQRYHPEDTEALAVAASELALETLKDFFNHYEADLRTEHITALVQHLTAVKKARRQQASDAAHPAQVATYPARV